MPKTSSSFQVSKRPWARGAVLALATGLVALLAWWLLVSRPYTAFEMILSANPDAPDPARAVEVRDQVMGTGAQILLGVAVLFGALLTWRRVRALEGQADSAHQGQLTERFTRAIDQLGSSTPAICLGGIYALERIAKDSARDYPQVMEVLCAFVREKTRKPDPDDGSEGSEKDDPEEGRREERENRGPATPVQAALDVLGRTLPETPGRRHLNLSGIRIPGADLSEAQLAGADLSHASLDGARLFMVDLSGAKLDGASLGHATLSRANLSRAECYKTDFSEAKLVGAILKGARLPEADLRDASLVRTDLSDAILDDASLERARLDEAKLCGANLGKVRNLTAAQLVDAHVDANTILPPEIRPLARRLAKKRRAK